MDLHWLVEYPNLNEHIISDDTHLWRLVESGDGGVEPIPTNNSTNRQFTPDDFLQRRTNLTPHLNVDNLAPIVTNITSLLVTPKRESIYVERGQNSDMSLADRRRVQCFGLL